jgi:small subunit ribosomal protein S21
VSGTYTRAAQMSEIVIGDNDRLEWALKAFRRKVQKSGVLKELRQKRFYVKPSTAKRLKAAAARRRKAERRRGSRER